MNPPTSIPSNFDDLPEPERSKALEFLKELLDQGSEETEAVEQARGRAKQWASERVLNSR